MTNEVAKKKELSMSERFTNRIISEFGSGNGDINITDFQRRLVSGYFVQIDKALATAEENRMRKDEKYRNPVPCTWNNVDMATLATDLVTNARLGLDMTQENMLFPIPFFDKKTGKYTITLMRGYNGVRYIAEKYAIEKPINVTIEVVYKGDNFVPIKKDVSNKVESYEYTIGNPFERNDKDILGAFAYLEFKEPEKNKLIILTLQEILKRRDAGAASADTWGGQAQRFVNGKKQLVELEGWMPAMIYKTMVREAFKPKYIPIDPAKIDESYQNMKRREAEFADMQVAADIAENNCKNVIDVEATVSDYEEPQQLAPAEEVDETPLNVPEPEKEEEPEF